MYYVQKTATSYYLSPVQEGALFSVNELPERPVDRKGYRLVLAVDEIKQLVWYEYKPLITPEPSPTDDLEQIAIDHEYRLTLLELGL